MKKVKAKEGVLTMPYKKGEIVEIKTETELREFLKQNKNNSNLFTKSVVYFIEGFVRHYYEKKIEIAEVKSNSNISPNLRNPQIKQWIRLSGCNYGIGDLVLNAISKRTISM